MSCDRNQAEAAAAYFSDVSGIQQRLRSASHPETGTLPSADASMPTSSSINQCIQSLPSIVDAAVSDQQVMYKCSCWCKQDPVQQLLLHCVCARIVCMHVYLYLLLLLIFLLKLLAHVSVESPELYDM